VARVVLVGLPGVGKTTVAKALEHRLGVAALDADDVFLATRGQSVQDCLRTDGEDRFRELEYDTLCDAVRDDIIYSCGGGVVRTEAARKLLATLPTVWLDAPDEVLLIRVADGDRPLLGDDLRAGIARLRAERSALYDEVAALRVNADDGIDNIVSAIADFVEKRS